MKRIIPLLIASASLVLAAAPAAPTIPYPMRAIPQDDPRFAKVLTSIRKAHAAEANLSYTPARPVDTNAMQRRGMSMSPPPLPQPKAPPFREALKSQIRNLKISQTVAPGEFLAALHGRTVHLKTAGESHVDGATIRGIIDPSPAKTYSYTDVSGAARTVDSFTFTLDPDADLTADRLVARLQAGATYAIQQGTTTTHCKDCNGAARLPVTVGKRSGDGKEPCKACRGAGKFISPQYVIVQW